MRRAIRRAWSGLVHDLKWRKEKNERTIAAFDPTIQKGSAVYGNNADGRR